MNMEAGNAISLLAKWIKTADASSENTRKIGVLTARKLGYSVYEFKRLVRAMRRQIGVVETLMSAGRWDEIRYAAVPSRAMMIYRNAFMRHDEERFGEFVQRAARGEETVHAATLFPYDIIEKVMEMRWTGCRIREDEVLEAQWRQLPDYVEAGTNALVIADTSGSMMGRPLATSVGLAVYFAERNTGAYHNMFMSFSGTSRIQVLKGDTLAQKLRSIDMKDWANNTNLEAAFKHVLEIAVRKWRSTSAATRTGLSTRRWRRSSESSATRSLTSSSGMWRAATMFSMPTRGARACSWRADSPRLCSAR